MFHCVVLANMSDVNTGESVPVYDGIPVFGSPQGSFFQIVLSVEKMRGSMGVHLSCLP